MKLNDEQIDTLKTSLPGLKREVDMYQRIADEENFTINIDVPLALFSAYYEELSLLTTAITTPEKAESEERLLAALQHVANTEPILDSAMDLMSNVTVEASENATNEAATQALMDDLRHDMQYSIPRLAKHILVIKLVFPKTTFIENLPPSERGEQNSKDDGKTQ